MSAKECEAQVSRGALLYLLGLQGLGDPHTNWVTPQVCLRARGHETAQSGHSRRDKARPVSARISGTQARRFDGEPASEERLLAVLRVTGGHVRALALRQLPVQLDLAALLQHLPG